MQKNKPRKPITIFGNEIGLRTMLLIIQCVISIALTAIIIKLGILPDKYVALLIAGLAFLSIITFLLMIPTADVTQGEKTIKKGKVRYIIGIVFSVVVSICLLVGVKMAWQGDTALRTIVGHGLETREAYLVVLKDSKYEKPKDLADNPVAMDPKDDKVIMEPALNALKAEAEELNLMELEGCDKLADALYNGDAEAIFISDATYAIIQTKHETFGDDTRVIFAHTIEIKSEDFSKDVNDITKNSFCVYITGIDTYGRLSNVARSDVNMIVTVNPETKQVLLSSIPRDYFIRLSNMGTEDKLTHSGLAGPQNTVKSVEDFLGIDINYYARVNFSSVVDIVDALGGITVDNPVSFYASPYQFDAGKIDMNGEEALRFARERYNVSGGDNGRVKNQELVVEGMINKLLSPAILKNYTGFLKSIDGTFQTNMEAEEISDLVKMQLDDMAKWTIVQKQFKGHGSMQYGGAYYPNEKLYYMIPDDDSVAENKQAIQNVLDGVTTE